MARRGAVPPSPRGGGDSRLQARAGWGGSQTPTASHRGSAPPGRAPTRPAPPSPRGKGKALDLILVGEFGRAHGLKGEVRLKSFTADPAAIARYGPLTTDGGGSLRLASVRVAPGGAPDVLVARVEGVTTRDAAEALNRTRLYVARDRLGGTEEDEFFAADLVGLAAQTPHGEPLGTVVAVPNYGGGDLLEIAPPRGATALVPFTKAFVPTVDLAERRVVVDAPDLFAPPEPQDP